MDNSTLIITNGDGAVAAIKNAEIEADFLPWRDFLHDGPVILKPEIEETSKIRAEFITQFGFGNASEVQKKFTERDQKLKETENYENIILWFEHDLYDQLQLLQVLDWIDNSEINSNFFLICEDQYIGESSADLLAKNYSVKEKLNNKTIKLGSELWKTFCSNDPKEVEKILEQDTRNLPFINAAIKRLLQEFPDEYNGLSRSEAQILEIVEEEGKTPGEIFRTFLGMENPKYHGDWIVFSYIHKMCSSEHPLLKYSNGTKSFPAENEEKFLKETIEITPKGKEVLQGRKNNLSVNGIDKWIGGVHLNRNNVWVRKKATGKLIKLIM
ncbi:MAG: DUF1835 domain-containing protein [Rhodothermaceae bacterium]